MLGKLAQYNFYVDDIKKRAEEQAKRAMDFITLQLGKMQDVYSVYKDKVKTTLSYD